MGLKEILDKKRYALLEEEQHQKQEAELQRQEAELQRQAEERQRQEAETQRMADAAVPPHPLHGRAIGLLDDYVRGQLVLRKEGKPLDEAGALLRPFAIALGMSLEHFGELQVEVSCYDEQSNYEMLQMLCNELQKDEEIICFLCDLVKLHGEEYTLEGDFLDLWRSVCMGLFHLSSEETAFLERFCARITKGGQSEYGDDFGKMPKELIQYYLLLPMVENGLYLVIDLSSGANSSKYPVRSTYEAPKLEDSACRTTELWLRRIPAGSFIMGSQQDELGRLCNETQLMVTLTQDYYIGVFPCTQRQYELVMGDNPSHFKGDDRPVEQVSYKTLRGTKRGGKWPIDSNVDENSFFGRLQGRTGLTLDLPTEAEWEYACRAGTTTALNSGKNLTSKASNCYNLNEVGWYGKNSGYCTHPVGQKHPNAWGIYDMHGTVEEWCLDWYGSYPGTAVTSPLGTESGLVRSIRGGSWLSYARFCRSSSRSGSRPSHEDYYTGFRVALRP
ncbi:MAG: SUMF1/EgtB/PvdO family nonheme iron enzyme [Victivallales bacterium]|nr:SUMF1/EgtB/PvdO family nonheme iron enzyme [Victivallales bacterium]